jgi:hypothetical protein
MKITNRNIQNTAIVGDVHSCSSLLADVIEQSRQKGANHFVFVGDLLDRGPDPVETIEIVTKLYKRNEATILMGNHDWKLIRLLDGVKGLHLSSDALITLDRLTEDSKKAFHVLFERREFALVDHDHKVMVSHAPGLRPYKLLDRTKDGINIPKKLAMTLLYGITDHDKKTSEGFPVRLPLTSNPYDDLNGWRLIHGHTHAGELHPEKGNPNVICVDFCAGQVDGRCAAYVFAEDTMDGTLVLSEKTTFD